MLLVFLMRLQSEGKVPQRDWRLVALRLLIGLQASSRQLGGFWRRSQTHLSLSLHVCMSLMLQYFSRQPAGCMMVSQVQLSGSRVQSDCVWCWTQYLMRRCEVCCDWSFVLCVSVSFSLLLL